MPKAQKHQIHGTDNRVATQIAVKTATQKGLYGDQDPSSSPDTPEAESIRRLFARTNRKLSEKPPNTYSSIIARVYYIPKQRKMQ